MVFIIVERHTIALAEPSAFEEKHSFKREVDEERRFQLEIDDTSFSLRLPKFDTKPMQDSSFKGSHGLG